jgi:hypothetical protein
MPCHPKPHQLITSTTYGNLIENAGILIHMELKINMILQQKSQVGFTKNNLSFSLFFQFIYYKLQS